MVKSLILLVVFGTVISDIVDTEKEFIYLGSFKSKARAQGLRRRDFDKNDYFISVHPATWSNAEDDCLYVFGGTIGYRDHTVVAIESVEEWEFLKQSLKNYEVTFWTSGIYYPITNNYIWAANDQPLPPFAPWGTGFPSRNPNGRLRVLANSSNIESTWHTVADTKVHRYICEVQKETVPVPCYTDNDLIIVLDSSGSIGSGNYVEGKGFANMLIEAFTVNKGTRIALITYSKTATKIIDLKNTLTPAEISSKIMSVDYTRGKTKTYLGIDLAVAQFKSSPRNVSLNMIVITDGMSDDLTKTTASAKKAVNMGIRTISVAVTPKINRAEIVAIAGGDPYRIFSMAIYGDLIQMLATISVDICSNVVRNRGAVTQIPNYGVLEMPDYTDYTVTEIPADNVTNLRSSIIL